MESNNSIKQNLMKEADSYCRIRDYKRAIDCINKVLQMNPKDTDAMNSKGLLY